MDNKKYIVLFLKRNDQDTLEVEKSQTFSDWPAANKFLKEKKNECGKIFECPSGKQSEKKLLQSNQQQLINLYKDRFEQAEAERKNETSPGMSRASQMITPRSPPTLRIMLFHLLKNRKIYHRIFCATIRQTRPVTRSQQANRGHPPTVRTKYTLGSNIEGAKNPGTGF